VTLMTYCHLVLLQHESQYSCSVASETTSESLISSKNALPFYFYSGSSDPVYFTHIFSTYMSALVLPLLFVINVACYYVQKTYTASINIWKTVLMKIPLPCFTTWFSPFFL
jgi:hypothetical protein